ncbi:phage tail domain-containing protein [Staphylococcus succinus]|uniref:phage tail domain-containing protein n=1 Tax=Staphylococcus succinus TaxID=61015 RepID=UPI00301D3487
MRKWVKMFDDNFSQTLTDIDGLEFLHFEEEDVEAKITTTEIDGVDGAMVSPSSFGPYKIMLRFFYRSADITDYRLLKHRLRGTLYKRTPFYINHSDMPGIKYAVYCEENAITDMGQSGQFEISFIVIKGYSESMYETDKYSTTSGLWQFGDGLEVNGDIKYKHTSSTFEIFNGSSDTIAPFPHRHKLLIKINVNAPYGFKLMNKTTGEVFEYKKPITKKTQLQINGVHPSINGKRVGIDTNHEWLTLLPGYNDIELQGLQLTDPTVEFVFPFIYR